MPHLTSFLFTCLLVLVVLYVIGLIAQPRFWHWSGKKVACACPGHLACADTDEGRCAWTVSYGDAEAWLIDLGLVKLGPICWLCTRRCVPNWMTFGELVLPTLFYRRGKV